MSKKQLQDELDYEMGKYMFLKKHGIRNEALSRIIDRLQVDIDNYDLDRENCGFQASTEKKGNILRGGYDGK